MSVCGLVKTWLPNERRALKPAECLVPLRRRGPGHTGPLFLLPTERPKYKTQLYRQTRTGSRKHCFNVAPSWNVDEKKKRKRRGRINSTRLICGSFLSPPPPLFWKNPCREGVGEGDFISSAPDYCRFVIPAPGRFKPQRCSSAWPDRGLAAAP